MAWSEAASFRDPAFPPDERGVFFRMLPRGVIASMSVSTDAVLADSISVSTGWLSAGSEELDPSSELLSVSSEDCVPDRGVRGLFAPLDAGTAPSNAPASSAAMPSAQPLRTFAWEVIQDTKEEATEAQNL